MANTAERRIVLKKDVRVFERTAPTSSRLGRTGKWLKAGETIVVGEPRTMVFDHRDQTVVSILDTNYFVIEEEFEVDPWYVVPPEFGPTGSPYLEINQGR